MKKDNCRKAKQEVERKRELAVYGERREEKDKTIDG